MTDLGLYFAKLGVLLVNMVLYLVLHELVHGICMRAFSGIRPHYGFTGLYAYAGSTAYFGEKAVYRHRPRSHRCLGERCWPS